MLNIELDKKFIFVDFDNIFELLDYTYSSELAINHPEVLQSFRIKGEYAQLNEEEIKEYFRVSFEDFINELKTGSFGLLYQNSTVKINDVLAKINGFESNFGYNIGGDVGIDIGRYTQGLPDCFIENRTDDTNNLVNIAISLTCDWRLTPETMLNRANFICNFIETLITKGYLVDIEFLECGEFKFRKKKMKELPQYKITYHLSENCYNQNIVYLLLLPEFMRILLLDLSKVFFFDWLKKYKRVKNRVDSVWHIHELCRDYKPENDNITLYFPSSNQCNWADYDNEDNSISLLSRAIEKFNSREDRLVFVK